MLALPHGAADTAGTPEAPPVGHQHVPRQERRQVRGDANRPHARPAAAVRDGERLVQVQVADVGADRRRAGQAHLRVHVRAVHVHLAAVRVDRGADVLDVLLVDAVRRRVGDHQARQPIAVLGGLGLQIGQVHFPIRRVGHDHHRHARHARRWPGWCRARRPGSAPRRAATRRARDGRRGSPAGPRTPPGRRSWAAATPRQSR